jgi:hypothetical protein
MENIGQAHTVEQAQHLRRIGALDLISLSGGTLQNNRTGRREDNDKNEQDDAGFARFSEVRRRPYFFPFWLEEKHVSRHSGNRVKLLKPLGMSRWMNYHDEPGVSHITQERVFRGDLAQREKTLNTGDTEVHRVGRFLAAGGCGFGLF